MGRTRGMGTGGPADPLNHYPFTRCPADPLPH